MNHRCVPNSFVFCVLRLNFAPLRSLFAAILDESAGLLTIAIATSKIAINTEDIEMDQRINENLRDRARRPIRNKRYNRRNYGEEKRPPKRLFTPEIKRFLKDWLVRRRDNPYPNRDEKKSLAVQTGLTYIQVCNWFANWRRKLKNAGKEPQRKTWGHLIKTYNNQVQGNVEHFSICSDDSIWQDGAENSVYELDPNKKFDLNNYGFNYTPKTLSYKNPLDHCYTSDATSKTFQNNNNTTQAQCFFVSSTTENDFESSPFSQSANKYKSHIMEKYLRDCQKPENLLPNSVDCGNKYEDEISKPSMISKWRESAANFKPSENNYLHWTLTKNHKKKNKKLPSIQESGLLFQQHGKEELDAAETLTKLANAHSNVNIK